MAMMFSDVLGKVREFLVEGESYSVLMNAEKREDQLRLTVHDMKPLETALEGKKLNLTIKLKDRSAIGPISELMKTSTNGGGANIHIEAIMEDRDEIARIELPGTFAFNGQTRTDLADIRGILEISES